MVMRHLKRNQTLLILIVFGQNYSTVANIEGVYFRASYEYDEDCSSTELCFFSFVVQEIEVSFL